MNCLSFNSISKLFEKLVHTGRICKKKSLGRPSKSAETLVSGRFTFGVQERKHVGLEAK